MIQKIIGKFKAISVFILFPCLVVISVHAADTTSNQQNSGFDMDVLQNELQNSVGTEIDSSVENTDEERGSILPVLIRIFSYLLIVVVLILGIAWVFKKIGLPGTVRNNSAGSLDLLEVLPLSQNRNISMIRIVDAVYIIGQSQQSMLLIEKIEGQKALELISASKDGNSIIQFKDALNTFMGKFKKSS